MILILISLILSCLILAVADCYIWFQKRRVCKYEHEAVLLAIAHPDDETMFFAPTLVTLHELQVPVRILCLTTGDADGKGKIRQNELKSACKYLGIPAANITVIDDPALPDSLSVRWEPDYVASLIESLKRKNEVLLTFDNYGISGHFNHQSCYSAVSLLKEKYECYKLVSSSVFVKYLGWPALLVERLTYTKSSNVFLLSPLQVINNVYGAMKQHQSQLQWFRLLYLIFSKYVFINTVEPIK